MASTLLARDARNRALRTFVQGLVADLVAAVVLTVLPVFTNATGWQNIDWKILTFLFSKTLIITFFSYVMRVYIDKRTTALLPPADPGEPDATAGA